MVVVAEIEEDVGILEVQIKEMLVEPKMEAVMDDDIVVVVIIIVVVVVVVAEIELKGVVMVVLAGIEMDRLKHQPHQECNLFLQRADRDNDDMLEDLLVEEPYYERNHDDSCNVVVGHEDLKGEN